MCKHDYAKVINIISEINLWRIYHNIKIVHPYLWWSGCCSPLWHALHCGGLDYIIHCLIFLSLTASLKLLTPTKSANLHLCITTLVITFFCGSFFSPHSLICPISFPSLAVLLHYNSLVSSLAQSQKLTYVYWTTGAWSLVSRHWCGYKTSKRWLTT